MVAHDPVTELGLGRALPVQPDPPDQLGRVAQEDQETRPMGQLRQGEEAFRVTQRIRPGNPCQVANDGFVADGAG